jgi:hypothetical protein
VLNVNVSVLLIRLTVVFAAVDWPVVVVPIDVLDGKDAEFEITLVEKAIVVIVSVVVSVDVGTAGGREDVLNENQRTADVPRIATSK